MTGAPPAPGAPRRRRGGLGSVRSHEESLLGRVARFASRHPGRVFVATLVLLLVSLALTTRLHLQTDILELLPPHDPTVRDFRETVRDFGSLDLLLVAVPIPEGAPLDPYFGYVDALGERLAKLPQMEYVDSRIGDVDELASRLMPNALLYLDAEAREKVAARLSEEGIRQRTQELRRILSTPQGVALKQLLKVDPMGLSEILVGTMTAGRGGLELDWTSGYFLSRDHRLLLVLAKPDRPAQDVEFGKALLRDVDAAVADVRAEWPRISGDDERPAPEVMLGGGYPIAASDASLIKRDVIFNMASSMACVLILFMLSFGRPWTMILAFVPLVVGIAVTFGFSALAVGSLSSATSGIAALLIGMGIDFVVICYGRYLEERRAGREVSPALSVMASTSGRAVVTGAVTTAATFYAFLVTDFAGLRQMGILTGTGILFCMAAVLVLLPAMLAWVEHRRARRDARPGAVPSPPPKRIVRGLGAGWLVEASIRRPWTAIVVALAISAALASQMGKVGFADTIEAMRPKGNKGLEVQNEITRHFGSGFQYMMVVVRGTTADEAVDAAARIADQAAELTHRGALAGYGAVTSLIPAPARQREAIAWLEDKRAQGLDAATVRARFDAGITEAGLRPEPFTHGMDLLGRALSVDRPIRAEDLLHAPEAERLLGRYLRETPSGWKSVVYVYPPPHQRWKRETPPELRALAEREKGRAILTGVNVVSEALRNQVKSDARKGLILGFVLVAILLAFDFHRLADAVLSCVPLVLGLVWMIGGMGALGLSMNFMNIFVTTMIIGIGVDYGIHVVHRFRESEHAALDHDGRARTLAETGKSVWLAALTTVVGFGSLATSHYPGLKSMGFVATMGTVATAIVALSVLPAVMELLGRRSARRATAEEPSATAPSSG